jgi:L-seryl-tRNA(Ser) seleniumtransferase
MGGNAAVGLLRKLPSVDFILSRPLAAALLERFPRGEVVERIRGELDQLREAILKGEFQSDFLAREVLADEILSRTRNALEGSLRPGFRRVINATGIILHTNLGRAPLPGPARRSLLNVAGYCTLEIDLEKGERGDRLSPVEDLLRRLTGAEAAAVVNNNAAAVLLALNTLAKGREVIVSRGQLIEIGGSFRLPEVMERSGAIMVEVGTTNKTRASDYAAAITERTAAILVAHPSNYRVLGFTEEPELGEVVEIANRHRIPLIHDLGGGILIPFENYGLPHEPLVQDSLRAGAHVVTFSGDKVIGGPQSGIIVGRREYVDRMRRNPLMRALRCDKLILAALESTLQLFRDERWLRHEHPVFRMLTEPVSETEARAQRFAQRLRGVCPSATMEVVDSSAEAGSGTLPLQPIPSKAIRLRQPGGSAEDLARRLRLSEPPVIPYVKEGWVYLDFRTIAEEELEDLLEVLKGALAA